MRRTCWVDRYILCNGGKGKYVCVYVCAHGVVSCKCMAVWSVRPELYLTVTPSFSSTRTPFSRYSSRVSQKLSLSFMMSASTAPPRNTMCFRLGGSSMRILNFYKTGQRAIKKQPQQKGTATGKIVTGVRMFFSHINHCGFSRSSV